MVNAKDINSTERLLNVIRGVQKSSADVAEAKPTFSLKQSEPSKFPVLFSRFKGRRRIRVAVDIGRDEICFAKVAKNIDGKPLLADQKILKIEKQINRNSDEFHELLKAALVNFAGSLEDCDIWAMMNAADVNVHHLKIPIVPKKQLEKVIYWTAKKESPIDENDVVFDYEMQGEIIDQGIPKYSVMVYSALKSEIGRIRDLFSSIEISLTGVTIAPFAIQNIFRARWIDVAESTFASVYIGYDFSRIDIFRKNNLVMTRGVKTGIGSMMEAVEESVAETLSEKNVDKNHVQDVLRDLFTNPEQTLKDENGILWTEEAVTDMIQSALERLTRQIERTLEYYSTSIGYEKVEKVYICSVRNVFYRPLLRYLGEQLGTPCESLDPLRGNSSSSVGSDFDLAEKAALVPVIGLALSHRNITPNAIFTYVDKNKDIRQKRINRGIFMVFGIALSICLFVIILQGFESARLNAQQEKLKKELSLLSPILSKEQISALAADLKLQYRANQQYAKKYKPMAIIRELSLLTPENIRLISVRIVMPVTGLPAAGSGVSPASGSSEQKASAIKEKNETVVIEGVVLGEKGLQESLLAQYALKLGSSPVLKNVSVQKSSIARYKKKEFLEFTLSAKIG